MRIPKINEGEIIFEPIFIGITGSVTKKFGFAAYTKIIGRAGFLKFVACCGTIRELGND
jgi:hypothetical protein